MPWYPAGAQLAGMEQQEAAQYLVDQMPHTADIRARGYRGAIFFAGGCGSHTADKQQLVGWSVIDRHRRCMLQSRSPVKAADALVIFDEARCR